MNAILLITAKDLVQRLRDRSLPLYALLLPLGLALVFDLTIGPAADGDRAFRYAVVDADRGAAAAAFVDQALVPVERTGVITLRRAATVEEGRRLVGDGEVAAAFVIPPGWSDAVRRGEPATLELIGGVDAPTAVEVARALAVSYAAEVRAVRLAVAVAAGGRPDSAQAEELAARAAAAPGPLTVQDLPASRRELGTRTYLAAGMAVFFLFFTVQFGVTGLLEERANGTLPRLLAAPIRPLAVLAAKMLVSVVVGLASMTALVVADALLLGARWGDPLGVALLVAAGVLAATGVMTLVAALARNAEQASQWQAVIAVALGALGGAFFQVNQIGGVVETLSLLTPHRWFLQGLADLAGGAGAGAVLPSVAALLAFAVVAGLPALWRLRKVVGA